MGFLINILANILLNILLNLFSYVIHALAAWLKVLGINIRGSLSPQDTLLNKADLESRVRRILGILLSPALPMEQATR
ncbi:MAG TPA: hypothetical protein VM238_12785 [Phycisphaerae bacterium]|nr:hypothetical protein [Phycisphaerae bacterium]